MFCKNCGKEVKDDSKFCQNCGVLCNDTLDTGNNGYMCLGCCVPIAGIVLYLVWKDQKPLTAKKCIQGFLLYLLFLVLYIITVFILSMFEVM
ncbi:zinc ribbon domain-containing protein [uncultured Tyzzerella sp.]|uniref:zinc ribbon domain-containing protein n=1 Tax=uncultured Tyzzerella sp. TaxID=2321398 RepID=UPI0029438CB0|nr:zinc ribbon domain-containing protein [uncultured Tyzzerella sp.]